MTFDEFRDSILKIVRLVGASFTERDDDWIAMVFHLSEDGHIYNYGADDWYDSPSHKEFFARYALPAMLKIERAHTVALLSSVWRVMVPATDRAEAERIAEAIDRAGGASSQPDRGEMLTLQFATVDRYEEWWAVIERQENGPPRLGPWELQPESTEHAGRMARLAQVALRKARLLQ